MKHLKKVVLVLAGVLMLTACSTDKVAETNYIQEDGSVRIGAEGAIRVDRDVEDEDVKVAPVTMDYFFDPACGPCSYFAESTYDTVKAEIDKGDLEVVYHPVAFLNSQTPDDFSNRAGAYVLAVAEYAPEKAKAFIDEILNTKFMPQVGDNGIEETPDEKFIELMKKAELTEEQIEDVEEHKEHFVSLVLAATEEFTKGDKWIEFSPAKGVFTPFVLINKTGELKNKAIDFSTFEGSFNDGIKEIIDSVK